MLQTQPNYILNTPTSSPAITCHCCHFHIKWHVHTVSVHDMHYYSDIAWQCLTLGPACAESAMAKRPPNVMLWRSGPLLYLCTASATSIKVGRQRCGHTDSVISRSSNSHRRHCHNRNGLKRIMRATNNGGWVGGNKS